MQIKQEYKEVDIFVGTKIGSFKHVVYNTDATKNSKKSVKNLIDIKSLQKDEGITCMEWGNTEQTEILIGKKNQEIEVYNTHSSSIDSFAADCGSGALVGLGRRGARLLAAGAGGVVRAWSPGGARGTEGSVLVSGAPLDRMRLCEEEDLFATGGEENDVKVFRIDSSEPVFSAKNLAHDWLQMRRPVWVSDLMFCPGEGGRLLAACSRYGYIRLYDSRAQRRPVCSVQLEAMAATCIAPAPRPRQVLVGFGRGQLHVADFRVSRLDKGFKGCAGAVRAAAAGAALVASVSLDRHLRVHSFDTKELLYKQYLTSKLTCVLLRTESGARADDCADELDEVFDQMDTIGSIPRKNKLPPVPTEAKKMKPSLEGSTVDLDDSVPSVENQEDAIRKLLRSTEKQKRRMEKKKKEKKAKSVFHNA